MKALNEIIQNEILSHGEILDKCCMLVGESIRSSIILIDTNGIILSEAISPDGIPLFPRSSGHDVPIDESEPAVYECLRNLHYGVENAGLNYLRFKQVEEQLLASFYGSYLPLKRDGIRTGILIAYRRGTPLDSGELCRLDMLSIICSVVLRSSYNESKHMEMLQTSAVKSALGTLTYSELEAALNVLRELPEKEGVLVTGRIADKIGVTHSVIVNALRKLESAGLIESRSLGMKGTHIRILNSRLPIEAAKIPL